LWGLAALVAGLSGGLLQLTQRRVAPTV
jgi:hypothetical protein